MSTFIEQHEYLVAWTVYLLAGAGCMVVWWKITSRVGPRGLQDFLRGVAIVVTFTPWYAGDAPDLFAPAIVVLMMDVFLKGVEDGARGGAALLVAMLLMLLVLIVRQAKRMHRDPGRQPDRAR